MVKIQVNSQGKAYYTSGGKVLLAGGGGDTVTVKNGFLHGAVTLASNGDISNFSTDNYVDSYFHGFNPNNFEIELKFTTGNDVSNGQMIMMLYGYPNNDRTKSRTEELRFQFYSSRFYLAQFKDSSLLWAADAYVGNVQANTTYWLKCVGSNNYQTYYVKEDGGEYQTIHTQSASNPNPFNYVVLGRSYESVTGNANPFSGIIHLANTSIKCNGVDVWKGTDVQNNQGDLVRFSKKLNIVPIYNICINNNLVYGFNSDNGVYCFKYPSSGSDFTFYGRFTHQPNASGQYGQIIYEFCDSSSPSSQFCITAYDNLLCVQGYNGVTTLVSGKTYDFKIEWDGSSNITQYIKESTSDTWITDCTITNFSNGSYIFDKLVYLGVNKTNGGDPFMGSMDLNYFKVTQGNNVVWQGVDDEYSTVSDNVEITPGRTSSYNQLISTSNMFVDYLTGKVTGVNNDNTYEVSTVLGE